MSKPRLSVKAASQLQQASASVTSGKKPVGGTVVDLEHFTPGTKQSDSKPGASGTLPRRSLASGAEMFYPSDHSHKDSVSVSAKVERVEGGLKVIDVISCSKEVLCIQFSPDGRLLAAGQSDGLIKLFKASNIARHHNLGTDDHTPVTCIRFQPTNTQKHFLLAAYASGIVRLWHYTSGKVVNSFDDGRQLLTISYNPDATKIITGGIEPAIHMYDASRLKKIKVFEAGDKRDVMDGHRARVFATIYHPVMQGTFLSGGWDDTVQFWDERQVHSVRNFYGPHICGEALDIDPQHNHILTGSWRKEKVLQIWDFGSGGKIKDVPYDHIHSCQMYCCQWMGKEAIIAGGSEQNICKVLDRGTLNTLGQMIDLPSAVYCLDSDHNESKTKIAAGTGVRIFMLKIDKKDYPKH